MKAICFLHYRAGSTFFQHLIGHTPRFMREHLGLPDTIDEKFFLTTQPSNQVAGLHTDCGSIERVVKELNGTRTQNWCICTHIGDWWGELPSYDIPTPYGSPTPMKWSYIELSNPIYKDLKFINLIRSGKNTIESTRRTRGRRTGISRQETYEERKNRENPRDYFKVLCKSWRNKVHIALDCQTMLTTSRYKIFSFEDLRLNPVETINKIYQFLFNLEADNATIVERIIQIDSIKKGKTGGNIHSSFINDKEVNKRWKNWNEEELEIYEKICGRTEEMLEKNTR